MTARLRSFLPWCAVAAILAGGGGILYAQLVPGERGVAPVDSSSNFEVVNIPVDVVGKTAQAARMGGWREAQRRGWKMLWSHVHGLPPGAAPALSDGTLDAIVSSIEVEQEQIGSRRYIARLGVLFDRGRTAGLLGGGGAGPHSEAMLVIPLEWSGGAGQAFERRTEWQRAWARFKAGASAVDYIRPTGTGADPLMLNAGQAGRRGRLWWRMLLDQYGGADVVVPEVHLHRIYPGGPVRADFVARHGPDGDVLGRFSLVAANPDQLDATLDEGVARIDGIYSAALAGGDLQPDPSLGVEDEPVAPPASDESAGDADPLAEIMQNLNTNGFTLQADTPDVAAVAALEAALRRLPGVHAAAVSSLAVGGVSLVRVNYEGDIDSLRLVLQAHGWRVDAADDGLRIRRGAPPPDAPPPAASAP